MVVGRASQARKLSSEEEKEMDPQDVQTIVEIYVGSLKDRENRHLITEKYADVGKASRSDIEQDVGCWLAGFTAGIRLVNAKASVPSFQTVLLAVTKRFEEEGIAA
jgi:hypothetical protein